MRRQIVSLIAIALLAALAAVAAAQSGHQHDHGHKHKLGRQVIGGYTVSVILLGEIEPGGHVDFDIKLIDVKTDPKTLRVWIGPADAAGAGATTKTEGKKGRTTYTGEIPVPKPLPDGAKLWVEIETNRGTSSGSFDLEEHG